MEYTDTAVKDNEISKFNSKTNTYCPFSHANDGIRSNIKTLPAFVFSHIFSLGA